MGYVNVYDEYFSQGVKIQMKPEQLMLDGKHFYRQCWRSAQGLWFIWRRLREAEKYIYTVQLSKMETEEKLFRWTFLKRSLFLANQGGHGLYFTD